jgi:hypothetical protein
MSKTAHQRKHKSKKQSSGSRATRTNDAGIYIGFIVIGGFIWVLAYLLNHEKGFWGGVTLGYVIALAFLMNLYAFQAYQGKRLANWQQSLARLPLRFAGYGTKGGKALAAAHNADRARSMVILSVLVSVAIVVLASLVLLPIQI